MCAEEIKYLPLSNFKTPESGAPSASMRRGFLISMALWWIRVEVAEFSEVSLGLSLWGSALIVVQRAS